MLSRLPDRVGLEERPVGEKYTTFRPGWQTKDALFGKTLNFK
jgi:hypothetical protein